MKNITVEPHSILNSNHFLMKILFQSLTISLLKSPHPELFSFHFETVGLNCIIHCTLTISTCINLQAYMSTIFYYLLKFEYDGSMAVLVTMLTQIIPL